MRQNHLAAREEKSAALEAGPGQPLVSPLNLQSVVRSQSHCPRLEVSRAAPLGLAAMTAHLHTVWLLLCKNGRIVVTDYMSFKTYYLSAPFASIISLVPFQATVFHLPLPSASFLASFLASNLCCTFFSLADGVRKDPGCKRAGPAHGPAFWLGHCEEYMPPLPPSC